MASQSISVKGVTKVDWEGEGGDATYEEMQNDVTVMPLSKYKKNIKVQNEIDQVQVQTVLTNQQSRRCQVTLEVCKHEKK